MSIIGRIWVSTEVGEEKVVETYATRQGSRGGHMRIIRTEAEMEERRLRRRAISQELRAENLVRRAVRDQAIDTWLTAQQLAPADAA